MTQQWWSIAHVIFFSSSSNFFNLGQVIATSDTKCKTPAGEIEPSPDLTYQVGVHLNLLENGGEFLKKTSKTTPAVRLGQGEGRLPRGQWRTSCCHRRRQLCLARTCQVLLSIFFFGWLLSKKNYVLLGLVRSFSVVSSTFPLNSFQKIQFQKYPFGKDTFRKYTVIFSLGKYTFGKSFFWIKITIC